MDLEQTAKAVSNELDLMAQYGGQWFNDLETQNLDDDLMVQLRALDSGDGDVLSLEQWLYDTERLTETGTRDSNYWVLDHITIGIDTNGLPAVSLEIGPRDASVIVDAGVDVVAVDLQPATYNALRDTVEDFLLTHRGDSGTYDPAAGMW